MLGWLPSLSWGCVLWLFMVLLMHMLVCAVLLLISRFAGCLLARRMHLFNRGGMLMSKLWGMVMILRWVIRYAMFLGTLNLYHHSVVFLAVIRMRKGLRVHKTSGALAAWFHLLAGAIGNFIAALIAATLNHLLAATFDLIAAHASCAATIRDVAHAITASLNFNVAVPFWFFLWDPGYFYFNRFFYFNFIRFFMFFHFNRLNWGFPG